MTLIKKLSPFKMVLFALRYGKCHECGSRNIGEGQGSFSLTENDFKRKCACGASIQSVNKVSK